jgi:hypothetical protein
VRLKILKENYFSKNLLFSNIIVTTGANVTNLSGAPLKGRLLASPTNIRLGWKGMPGTSTLTYYENM